MEKMIDIVIPLGTGSKWKNNELRYCLRSIEKYARGVGRVYLVGELPSWINTEQVTHLKSADDKLSPRHKERNIMNKLLIACQHEEITGQFLYMNDDHFLMESVWIPAFPAYHSGHRLAHIGHYNMRYQRTVNNTAQALSRAGLRDLHYDIHVPIRLDKYMFVGVTSAVDWNVNYGYLIKSLYANSAPNAKVGTQLVDCKINTPLTSLEIEARIAGRPCFSIGDGALRGGIGRFLESKFPEKSKYEI